MFVGFSNPAILYVGGYYIQAANHKPCPASTNKIKAGCIRTSEP